MKKGYDVFGIEYEIMLRNDCHDINSVDHLFLKEMVLLEESSLDLFYPAKPQNIDMKNHELYQFSQKFKGDKELESIKNIINFTSEIAKKYDVPIEEMLFGGTEKQILERGTDWCADMARVAAVLLNCIGISTRILHLANDKKAYYGHVVIEAFYEDCWGILDPLLGYIFYETKPLSAGDIFCSKEYLKKFDLDYAGYYSMIAINEYNPMDSHDYSISPINEYTLCLNTVDHNEN